MNDKMKTAILISILGIFSSFFIFIIVIDQPKFEISTEFISHSPDDDGCRITVVENITSIDNGTNLKQTLFVDPMYELIQECQYVFKVWELFEEGVLPKYIPIQFFKAK